MTYELTILAIFFSRKLWDVICSPGSDIVTTAANSKVYVDVHGIGLGLNHQNVAVIAKSFTCGVSFELMPHRPPVSELTDVAYALPYKPPHAKLEGGSALEMKCSPR